MSNQELKRSDFSYTLPDHLVAQHPSAKRDESKLLVFNGYGIEQSLTKNLWEFIEPNSLIVRNNSKVIPSRLIGKTQFGGKVELMLIEPLSGTETCSWKALGKPLKKMKKGSRLFFNECEASIIDKIDTVDTPYVTVTFDKSWDEFYLWIDQSGYIPLPPYIKREQAKTATESKDTELYQTVYAQEKGSVAAPTAGLHFTPELIENLKTKKNVDFADVTLHVGAGTFLPVKSDTLSDHSMHFERYFVGSETLAKIEATRKSGHKVYCVGTTSLRCVESFYLKGKQDKNWSDFTGRWLETDLFIYPRTESFKYKPGLIDGIMTNFHQSESTLIMLISSLIGYQETKAIYEYAKNNEFRFFSYGDSSLLKF